MVYTEVAVVWHKLQFVVDCVTIITCYCWSQQFLSCENLLMQLIRKEYGTRRTELRLPPPHDIYCRRVVLFMMTWIFIKHRLLLPFRRHWIIHLSCREQLLSNGKHSALRYSPLLLSGQKMWDHVVWKLYHVFNSTSIIKTSLSHFSWQYFQTNVIAVHRVSDTAILYRKQWCSQH